jgi:hypothetical protein
MRFHSRCTSCIVAHLAIYIMLECYDVCIKVAFNENVQGDDGKWGNSDYRGMGGGGLRTG